MADPIKSLNIDKNSYQPAYAQIADAIRQQIGLGHYPPGSRLPSESQLCHQFEVSSVTVRRAISVLVDQGIVVTTKGKGSFVKPPELRSAFFQLTELQEIFDDTQHTDVKILFARIIPAEKFLIGKLPVVEGDRVIHIRSLISNAQKPLIYHHQYMIYDPSEPIVEAELNLISLGGLFTGNRNTNIKKGSLHLKPAVLSKDEARHLNGDPGMPGFKLEHTFYDLNDQRMSWGWFIFFDSSLTFRSSVGVWQDN